jgi:hypothetical protein
LQTRLLSAQHPCGLDKLSKWLFPNNPKMVRNRKLQVLFFTIVLTLLACVIVGLLLYLMSVHASG